MLHRLTECGVRQDIWERTRTRIARVRIIDPRRVSTEWLLRPSFELWPRQRHQMLFWILSNMFFYLVHQRRKLSVMEYTEFMRRTRWKIYQNTNRMKLVG